MPDRSIWAVPAEIVAESLARHYAKADGEAYLKEDYENALSDNSLLLDWAENNMNWKDVCQAAFQVSPGKVDYQEGWVNGPKQVVEGKL
jgi:hypothetical protein